MRGEGGETREYENESTKSLSVKKWRRKPENKRREKERKKMRKQKHGMRYKWCGKSSDYRERKGRRRARREKKKEIMTTKQKKRTGERSDLEKGDDNQ